MKGKIFSVLGVLALVCTIHTANAQSTTFTYQGGLSDDNSPANGSFDMTFGLFRSETSGTVVSTATKTAVEVVNGLFTATLDFGSGVFDGRDYWLEIAVSPHNSLQPPVILNPRQPLQAAPYSLHARSATEMIFGNIQDPAFIGTVNSSPLIFSVAGSQALRIEPDPEPHFGSEHSHNLIAGFLDNSVTPGVRGATIAGGGGYLDIYDFDPTPNVITADFAVIGGGLGNTNGGYAAVIGGGQGNHLLGNNATVHGGSQNTIGEDATRATIGGGWLNIITAQNSTISGGANNTIDAGSAVIGGGQGNNNHGYTSTIGGGTGNIIQPSSVATISGGSGNIIHPSSGSTIGGGSQNLIQTSAFTATIAGGTRNTIGNNTSSSTIGGGVGNTVRASAATICGGGAPFKGPGGLFNTIETGANAASITGGLDNMILSNAFCATIAGGKNNRAGGYYSFAAGRHAQAVHDGCFVWADFSSIYPKDSFEDVRFQGIPFPSITTNEFAARATGGVRFVTAIDTNGTPTAGVSVPAGGTGWSVISDRNMKENVEQVDGRVVLDQVAAMPISTWNMKSQDPSIRHIGPMAQDFHAAFGLGENNRRINTVDADGVALAAIQGLHSLVKDQEAALARKDAQIEELTQAMASLMDRVERLEQGAQP